MGPQLVRDWIIRAAKTHPQKPWIVSAEDGRSITYAELHRLTGRMASFLRDQGIGAGVHYPKPLHLQGAFSTLGHRAGDFPVAERAAAEILSLPLYPEITVQQQERVVDALRKALS